MSDALLRVPDVAERLDRGLDEMRVPLPKEARAKLLKFLALIEKWNQVYNLTAIKDSAQMVSVHLLDCLATAPHIIGHRLLDVGSGAGLPGIPLALAKPAVGVTVLDSSHKKTAFLRQVVMELELENVNVVCERVENWRSPARFDFIVSRAYAELAEFVGASSHLLAPNGVFAAMKGVYPFEEIARLPREFRVNKVIRLQVPILAAERHLVMIQAA
jgi:16S rRNA (guanine527-N7)-methyltransferase